MLALWYCCCVDICVSLWCCSDIIGWQGYCGVVLVLLLVDKSIVVLFWCYYWLTRAWVQRWRSCGVIVVSRCTQAQRYQNGSKFWDKGGKSGQPTPVHPLYTLAYPCAHSSSTPWYRLWYTLVPTLVQPGIPWYTLWTHLYTLVLSSSLTFGRICTFLYNATLRIFLTLLILCTWRHNMLFLQ